MSSGEQKKICKQSPGGVLQKCGPKNFAKYLKTPVPEPAFLMKLSAEASNINKKETLVQVFSCEFLLNF